jgi:phosphopantetheine--protein transferase-like protein
MIAGCGIDTEERARFEKHISKFEDSEFISMVFSSEEKINFLENDIYICVPLAFSCKEAIFKALGNSWTTSAITWHDIQISFGVNNENKNFLISLKGEAARMIKELGNPSVIGDYFINDEFVTFEIILKHE